MRTPTPRRIPDRGAPVRQYAPVLGRSSHLLAHANIVWDRVRRGIARPRLVARVLVKVRNQSNFIVAKHLTPTPDPRFNGEYLLVETVAPHVRFFLDVGAHLGEWAAYLLERNPHATGVLFEPNPRLAALLSTRFPTGSNVRVQPLAVSDEVGTGTLHLHESDMMSSLTAVAPEASRGHEPVKVTTIDNEARSWPTIDFLKIDAEGHDARVLAGARRQLAARRIRILTFEYNESWRLSGSTLGATLELLRRFGYETFLVSSKGLMTFDYRLWGEFFEYANFAAVRREDRTLIRPLFPVTGLHRSRRHE